MSGKGDTRRPSAITAEEYARRWEATFGWRRGLIDVCRSTVVFRGTLDELRRENDALGLTHESEG